MNDPQMDWSVIIIADSKLRGLLETLSQISNTILIFEHRKYFGQRLTVMMTKGKTIGTDLNRNSLEKWQTLVTLIYAANVLYLRL